MQTRLNWTLRRDREPTATGCLSARADLSMCIGRASHQSHLSVSRASRLCWNEVMLGHCHDDRQYRLSPRCRSPSGGRTASRRYTLIRSYEHTVGESPVQGSAYRAKHVLSLYHGTTQIRRMRRPASGRSCPMSSNIGGDHRQKSCIDSMQSPSPCGTYAALRATVSGRRFGGDDSPQ